MPATDEADSRLRRRAVTEAAGAGCSVSFVITARDEPGELLLATLGGLRATAADVAYEIVLLDDGSVDPIGVVGDDVRHLRNEPALGVSRSFQRGLEAATGDVIVLLDAHLSFRDGWLGEMLAVLDDRTLLCPAGMDYDLRRELYYGANLIWRDWRWSAVWYEYRTDRPVDDLVEVPTVIGACYAATRTVFERLGGLNPRLRAWGHLEQDLSLRAWASGCRVACAPRAGVGHHYRKKNPNPPGWREDLHNRRVVVSNFEPPLAGLLLGFLDLGPDAERDEALEEWQAAVQARRRIDDRALLDGPLSILSETLPVEPGEPLRYRRGRWPRRLALDTIRREHDDLARELGIAAPARAPSGVSSVGGDDSLPTVALTVICDDRVVVLVDEGTGCASAVALALSGAGARDAGAVVLDGAVTLEPVASRGVPGAEPRSYRPRARTVDAVVLLRWEAPDGCEVADCTPGEVRLALVGSVVGAAARARAMPATRELPSSVVAFAVSMGSAREAAWLLRAELGRRLPARSPAPA